MNTAPNLEKIKSPVNVLYRSRIEICRILETLAKDKVSISSDISENRTFTSHILVVNQRKGSIVISCCANKILNNKILKLPVATFYANNSNY